TITATHLIEAMVTKNMVDIHTTQPLMELTPIFVTGPPDCSIEDTYVHCCIASILKSIFD
ncbi:hypothetical protein BC941DRAFT_356199, partial [Chlamydoabsidia padenii]